MEKYLPVDVASKWSLQPVHVDKENALSHNLGSKLAVSAPCCPSALSVIFYFTWF